MHLAYRLSGLEWGSERGAHCQAVGSSRAGSRGPSSSPRAGVLVPRTAAYPWALHGRGSLGPVRLGSHVVRQLTTPPRPNVAVLGGPAPTA